MMLTRDDAPDRRHGVSTCNRKEKYGRIQARRVAANIRRQPRAEKVQAYECRICGHWHVGKVVDTRTR